MGLPSVATTLAAKSRAERAPAHQSAALRQSGAKAGSVDTLGMRITSNRRARASSRLASSALRTSARCWLTGSLGIYRRGLGKDRNEPRARCQDRRLRPPAPHPKAAPRFPCRERGDMRLDLTINRSLAAPWGLR